MIKIFAVLVKFGGSINVYCGGTERETTELGHLKENVSEFILQNKNSF